MDCLMTQLNTLECLRKILAKQYNTRVLTSEQYLIADKLIKDQMKEYIDKSILTDY